VLTKPTPDAKLLKSKIIIVLSMLSLAVILIAYRGSAVSLRHGQSAGFASFLAPCHPPNVDGEALCGKYEVFEDRRSRSGRKIGLNIVVLPALGKDRANDPVFWLHGGPGAAATQTVPAAKGGFLEQLRKNRDLVFVDQRGTGQSNGLKCDIGDDPSDLKTFFGPLFPLDKVRKCRELLEKGANLKLYTTPIAMDDLDEVRAALGYEKINLVAASYGTIAALVYMRQHGKHLRAVFLAGVANTNIRQPLHFPAAAEHAIDLLFEDCAADPVCHNTFPKLKEEFTAVLGRFNDGPVTTQLINPATKQKEVVEITRGNFVERIRLLLYTTTFARFVPLIIHRAFENDYLPFEELAVAYNPGSILARGMYLTVTCSEGVPFIKERDIRATRRTFVGESRVRSHIEACKEWPKAGIPASYLQPVKSEVPVLMMSGELDGSTPPRLGTEAMAHLSNGRQVKIRYYGHQVDSPCVWKVLADFVNAGTNEKLDTSCTSSIRRPPFATEPPKQFSLQ
jgi:pimeloyl-ACP methyl ester carboxylesterase